jgi:hypothetical protein
MFRRLFHLHHQLDDDGRTRKSDAIRFLIEAWESPNADVVRKASGIDEDAHGNPDDDNNNDAD